MRCTVYTCIHVYPPAVSIATRYMNEVSAPHITLYIHVSQENSDQMIQRNIVFHTEIHIYLYRNSFLVEDGKSM